MKHEIQHVVGIGTHAAWVLQDARDCALVVPLIVHNDREVSHLVLAEIIDIFFRFETRQTGEAAQLQ